MKINISYKNDDGKQKHINLSIPLFLFASKLGSRFLSKTMNKSTADKGNVADKLASKQDKLAQKKDKLDALGIHFDSDLPISDNASITADTLAVNTNAVTDKAVDCAQKDIKPYTCQNITAQGTPLSQVADTTEGQPLDDTTSIDERTQTEALAKVNEIRSTLDDVLSIDADGKRTTLDSIGDALENSDYVDIKLKPKQVAHFLDKHIDDTEIKVSSSVDTSENSTAVTRKKGGKKWLSGVLAQFNLTPQEIREIMKKVIKEMRKHRGVTLVDVYSPDEETSVKITI